MAFGAMQTQQASTQPNMLLRLRYYLFQTFACTYTCSTVRSPWAQLVPRYLAQHALWIVALVYSVDSGCSRCPACGILLP